MVVSFSVSFISTVTWSKKGYLDHKIGGHQGRVHQLVYTLGWKYTDFHTCATIKVMIVLTYLISKKKKSVNFAL